MHWSIFQLQVLYVEVVIVVIICHYLLLDDYIEIGYHVIEYPHLRVSERKKTELIQNDNSSKKQKNSPVLGLSHLFSFDHLHYVFV